MPESLLFLSSVHSVILLSWTSWVLIRGVLDVGRRGDGCVYYEYLVYYCCIPYTTITTTTHRSDEDNLCLVHDSSAGLSVERLTLILDCTHVYRSKDN